MRAMRQRLVQRTAAVTAAAGGGEAAWRARTAAWLAGAALALLAGALAMQIFQALAASQALRTGVLASLLAGLATALGALPLLAIGRFSAGAGRVLLGASGGVMLAAALLALVLPAFAHAAVGFGPPLGALVVAGGLALGAAAIKAADRALPHLHPSIERGTAAGGAWLLVAAIGLHNFPEGFAVGAGFGGEAAQGWAAALAIGAQNVPEGLVVAAAVASMGHSRIAAIAVAGVTGLFEPVGALAGGMLAGFAPVLLPMAMALAAGAMLFVVMDEVVPALRRAAGTSAWVAMAAGMAAMAWLDAALA